MAFIYEIPISLFPGGVAPDSWNEFVHRVETDPGIMTVTLEAPKWAPVEYGVSIGLYFDAEPTGDDRDPGPATGEKLVIDNLASADPHTPVATFAGRPAWYTQSRPPNQDDDESEGFKVPDVWIDTTTLEAYICTDATDGVAVWTATDLTPRDYFEDFGADTSTSGLAVRMQETPTFLAGRYEIGWTSQVDATVNGSDIVPRFFFDGAQIMDMDISANPVTPRGFDGKIERLLTAGAKEMRLEIEKVSGGGSARMRYSTMWYRYISKD